jgi:DNA-binding transcriptional LysR family regulator
MVVDAALSGVGLAFIVEDQVSSLIQAGALKRVLADWCAPFPGFYLYYPGRRQVSPALAAFIEAIRLPVKAAGGL